MHLRHALPTLRLLLLLCSTCLAPLFPLLQA
jgi:hypothetical protein